MTKIERAIYNKHYQKEHKKELQLWRSNWRKSGASGCVYKIVCSANGMTYVGSTLCYSDRVARHIYNLRNNIHPNPKLQEDYNMYRLPAFEFIRGEHYTSKRDLFAAEARMLKRVPTSKRYNCQRILGGK